MPERQRTQASVVAFFALAYILSWTVWLPCTFLYPPPATGAPGRAAILLQQLLGSYGPSLAALLMLALFGKRGELKGLLARLRPCRLGLRGYAAALLLPLALLLPALLAYALLGGRLAGLPWAAIPPTFALSMLVSGLGEELGWRGYALPRLQAQLGPCAASAVIGLLWAGWHLPVFLWASPQTGFRLLAEYALYALILVAYSFLLTRAYNASGGSLWPVVLMHAATTATLNMLLAPLSPGRAGTWLPYLVAALSACGAAAWVAVRPAARPDRGRMPSAPTVSRVDV